MVIPEKEQQERKKRRDEYPNNRRRSNPNDVTANILSKQGRHRHTRGPPTKSPRKMNNSEDDNTDDHTEKKRPHKKKAKVSSTPKPEETPETTETEKAPVKREFQTRASHTKVAGLIAKCLPHRDCQVFLKHFETLKPGQAKTEEERERRDAIMKTYGSCRKTPIWSLRESLMRTYGSLNVKFDRMQPGEFITSGASDDKKSTVSLKFYLLDCILDRRVCLPATMSNDNSDRTRVLPDRGETNEVVWKVPCKSEDDLHPDMDHKFTHAITVVPDAMIFYTYMERLEDPSLSMDMSLVPIGISWLRLLGTKEGWFAKGGFVKYLLSGDKARKNIASTPSDQKVSAWKIEIFTSGHQDQICRLYAIQSPDLYGPRWPPDIFPDEAGHVKDDPKTRRDTYMKLLNKGNTTRIGAKWHVSGTLYSQMPPKTALVIVPSIHGAHDITVSIQRSHDEIHGSSSTKTRDISVVCQSIVSIRYLKPLTNEKVRSCLQAITKNAETIRINNTATVRNDPGDKGKMYALGCKVDPQGECLVDYAGNKHVKSSILPNAVEAMEYLGSIAFPNVLRPIQDMERVAGCECLPCMEKVKIDGLASTDDAGASASKHTTKKGSVKKSVTDKTTSSVTQELQKCKVGLTMDISCNLQNSAHYDVNDATTGYAVWTETRPGNQKQRWYFVLPNVFGKYPNNDTYEGVAVALEDGVAISWDGRRIKHCSYFIENTKHPNNFLYGTFCGTKYNLINSGLEGKGRLKKTSEKETNPTDTNETPGITVSSPPPEYPAVPAPTFPIVAPTVSDVATMPMDTVEADDLHDHMSERIPKKPRRQDTVMHSLFINDEAKKKAAAKTVPEETIDYATMKARCFANSLVSTTSNKKEVAKVMEKSAPTITQDKLDSALTTARNNDSITNADLPTPCWVIDVTHDDVPTTPTDVAVLNPTNQLPLPTTREPSYWATSHKGIEAGLPKRTPTTPTDVAVLPSEKKLPELPPTTKNITQSSPYDWWIQLDHMDKLKFLIDHQSTTERFKSLLPKHPDLDWILQKIFPPYVLSPIPPDMMAKMEAGVEKAVVYINNYYQEGQNRIDTEAALADSDEDSKESGCYTSDSTFQGQPRKPSGTYFWGKYVHRENAVDFVRALPRLLLTFTCSFHAQNEDDQECVCPCSYKAVSPWMNKLMKHCSPIAESLETANCNKKNKLYTARSLVNHLRGTRDPIHQAVYIYVTHLYSHFYANQVHHEALYQVNSPNYRRAIIIKHRRN